MARLKKQSVGIKSRLCVQIKSSRHTLLLKEMPLHRSNKNSLKQPRVTSVVPGGAQGAQAGASRRRGRRPAALCRRSASAAHMCAAAASSRSAVIKRCHGRCRNTSLKQDKWCVMRLALARLFIDRFKGQVAVSNYALSGAAAAFSVGDSSLSPGGVRRAVRLTSFVTFEVSRLRSVWAQAEQWCH